MSNQIVPKLQKVTKRESLIVTQIKIQQSFTYPHKIIPMILLIIPYFQILKYPFDPYIGIWLNTTQQSSIVRTSDMPFIFSYLSISTFTESIPQIVSIVITLCYVLFYLVILFSETIRQKKVILSIYKGIQQFFTAFLYVFLVTQLCKPIKQLIKTPNQGISWDTVVSLICLAIFCSIIILQNHIYFDWLNRKSKNSISRISNWSTPMLLIYIVTNEIVLAICADYNKQISFQAITPHLILMNVIFGLLTIIMVIKPQIEDQIVSKCIFIVVYLNLISILMVDAIFLLQYWLDFAVWGALFVVGSLAIWFYQGFNIKFELENINKWSNSQMMMQYTRTLQKLNQNKQDYYMRTLVLGYIDIHNQKCDNQMCPLKLKNKLNPQQKIIELIKKIYGDGCNLSPISQQLLIQYATFLFESGNRQKSLKVILSIEKSELSFEKLCYYAKLEKKVYKQISEQPNQSFLDIFSEMQVKQYENQIIKKFQQCALANLQFWSVLNEDHPDFNKLYELGVKRIKIAEKINQLYTNICRIAHSEKITQLYIHYLRDIQNDQCMYSEIFNVINDQRNLQSKIVIEDWANTSNAILIVSTEQGNKGNIIDLNTTCATIFGYEKYELISRSIQQLFPELLSNQTTRFLKIQDETHGNSVNMNQTNKIFFAGTSNGYCIRIKRTINHFNSLQTGPSVIINIEKQFALNTCYLLFTNDELCQTQLKTLDFSMIQKSSRQNKTSFIEDQTDGKSKLISLSSSCIQYLSIDNKLVQMKKTFNDIFLFGPSDLQNDRMGSQLRCFLNMASLESILQKKINDDIKKKWYAVQKIILSELFAVSFCLNKQSTQKNNSKLSLQQKIEQNDFCFKVTDSFNQFTYIGGSLRKPSIHALQSLFTMSIQDRQTIERRSIQNYAQNITTLRLHENYIKVIEQGEQQNQRVAIQGNSDGQTLESLLQNSDTADKLAKKDEQKILQSHKKYCEFLQMNKPKSNILIFIAIFCLISLGTYIANYFIFKNNFEQVISNYNKILNKNGIIGQIAIARFLLMQIKLSLITNKQAIQPHILQSMSEYQEYTQALITQYTQPFNLDVGISQEPFKTKNLISDQFFLSYAGYFDQIYNDLQTEDMEIFNIRTISLNNYDQWFIQYNGNVTKQVIIQKSVQFLNQIQKKVVRVNQKSSIILGSGILLQILFIVILSWIFFRLNRRKIEILQIFLDSNQRIIQDFSSKTQSFLMTLHVEEASESTQINQDTDTKKAKHFSNMFAKKKRFKSTKLPKTPYIILVLVGIVSMAYYAHSSSTIFETFIFVNNSYQYGYKASQLQNMLYSGVGKIKQQILQNYENPSQYSSRDLAQAINTFNADFIVYQKQFLQLHYKTFGKFQQFHEYFVKIYLEDICKGQVQIQDACLNPLTNDGVSIVITELTVNNQMIWEQIMQNTTDQNIAKQIIYFNNLQIIKNSQKAVRDKSIQYWEFLRNDFNQSFLQILIVWICLVIVVNLILTTYVHKVALKNLSDIQSMLKVLPISFATENKKVQNYLANVLNNK